MCVFQAGNHTLVGAVSIARNMYHILFFFDKQAAVDARGLPLFSFFRKKVSVKTNQNETEMK